MHSFFILGIVLLMAIVNTTPVTDGISSDGTTAFIGDQLDSELNFQPLPKIVALIPVKVDPGSDSGTKGGSNTQLSTPKPVISAASSGSNLVRGNATSTELAPVKTGDPDPTRDYFREDDFQCPKKFSFIGCCDGGDFEKCQTFNAQKPICKKAINMSCCHRVVDPVSLPIPIAYKCDSKAKQLSGPLLS